MKFKIYPASEGQVCHQDTLSAVANRSRYYGRACVAMADLTLKSCTNCRI